MANKKRLARDPSKPTWFKCTVCKHKTTNPLMVVSEPEYRQCVCSQACMDLQAWRRENPPVWPPITSRWRDRDPFF